MTWIDYEKFHELMRSFYESDGKLAFSSEDYMAPTPDWAVFGATEQGFDPAETRTNRKKRETAGQNIIATHATVPPQFGVQLHSTKNGNSTKYSLKLIGFVQKDIHFEVGLEHYQDHVHVFEH
ncbi:unnamed protein product, partial [Notodromas monacha]